MTVTDPADARLQEKRELLVWGAIPALVGGVGLIIDGIYVINQYASAGGLFPGGALGAPGGGMSRFTAGLGSYFMNTIAGEMIAAGAVALILLALSRFGKRRLAVIGSVALLVFAVVLLGYLIYALITGAAASIYSLALGLLILCLAVAGGSGLLAHRAVAIH